MTTIYQFGTAQLVEDLIFGWCFRESEDQEWTPLKEFPTEVLNDLSSVNFPAYMPASLQKSIHAELQRRKTEIEKGASTVSFISEIWSRYRTKLETVLQNERRMNDRLKLLSDILQNISGTVTDAQADLGYVVVKRTAMNWSIQGRGDRSEVETFETLYGAVDRIMARWW